MHTNGSRYNITRRISYKKQRIRHSKATTMQRRHRRKSRRHISRSAATPSLPAIKYSTSRL